MLLKQRAARKCVIMSSGEQLTHKLLTGMSNSNFEDTHWSMVDRARNPETCDAAIQELARDYRKPIFAYCLGLGLNHHDAEDLTQQFFFKIIEKPALLQVANPSAGRLRDLLIAALKYLWTDLLRKQAAKKRGGDVSHHSLDADLEWASGVEDTKSKHAVDIYERDWAITQFRLTQLQAGIDEDVMKHIFKVNTETAKAAALRMGITPEAFNRRVFEAKARFASTLRTVVSRGMGTNAKKQIDEEYAYIVALLMNNPDRLKLEF